METKEVVNELENIISQVKELEEQNKAEDGAFEDFDSLNKVEISKLAGGNHSLQK